MLSGHDELLLLTILNLKDNAYGATMMKHLTKVTGKEWSIGAIYDPLYRLEKTGYVKSDLSMPSQERGGRSKRVYTVTKKGVDALQQHLKVRRELSDSIPELDIDNRLKYE